MEETNTERAPPSIGSFSQAICDGETKFGSGRGLVDPDSGVMVGISIRVERDVVASVSK